MVEAPNNDKEAPKDVRMDEGKGFVEGIKRATIDDPIRRMTCICRIKHALPAATYTMADIKKLTTCLLGR